MEIGNRNIYSVCAYTCACVNIRAQTHVLLRYISTCSSLIPDSSVLMRDHFPPPSGSGGRAETQSLHFQLSKRFLFHLHFEGRFDQTQTSHYQLFPPSRHLLALPLLAKGQLEPSPAGRDPSRSPSAPAFAVLPPRLRSWPPLRLGVAVFHVSSPHFRFTKLLGFAH